MQTCAKMYRFFPIFPYPRIQSNPLFNQVKTFFQGWRGREGSVNNNKHAQYIYIETFIIPGWRGSTLEAFFLPSSVLICKLCNCLGPLSLQPTPQKWLITLVHIDNMDLSRCMDSLFVCVTCLKFSVWQEKWVWAEVGGGVGYLWPLQSLEKFPVPAPSLHQGIMFGKDGWNHWKQNNEKAHRKKVAAQLGRYNSRHVKMSLWVDFGVKLPAACWWWIRCRADIRNLKANRVRVV